MSTKKSNMKKHKNTDVWTTQNGRNVRICDMTDTHLINTIEYLERSDIFVGNVDIEDPWGDMISGTEHDLYPVLCDERKRRGL